MTNSQATIVMNDILRDGFGIIPGVLPSDKSDLLIEKCKEILHTNDDLGEISIQSPKSGKIYNNSETIHTAYATSNRSLIGVSQIVDKLIEEILTDEIVVSTLVSFLGTDYKVYTCAIRHATHLSSYAGLHQDGYHQFSMAYFLNDIDHRSPTTVFYKKTHNIPFKFRDKFETFDTKYFKSKLSPAVGKKGDILFFLNRTLHGMQSSLRDIDESSVILFCFHPSGYPHSSWRLPEKSKYSESFISGLGPELQRLFEHNPDHFININGEVILKNASKTPSRLIDIFALNEDYSGNYLSTIYWYGLYYIFFIFRVVRKIFRVLTR